MRFNIRVRRGPTFLQSFRPDLLSRERGRLDPQDPLGLPFIDGSGMCFNLVEGLRQRNRPALASARILSNTYRLPLSKFNIDM